MSRSSLVFSTLIALAMAYGLIHLGSRIHLGAPSLTTATQTEFVTKMVQKLNTARNSRGVEELSNDTKLQGWLDSRLDAFFKADGSGVDVSAMLDDLPLKLHTVTNAAARTIEADEIEDLLPQLEYWAEGYAEETRIIAARLFEAPRGKVGCALIAAKTVPEFELALLNEGITEFYNTCRHCEQPHLGTLEKVNLALAVSCPHCDRTYDLLAADMMGKYHRANEFLEDMRPPPAVGADAETRMEEMVAIWSAVAEHCRYTVDLGGSSGARDTWQRPSETYSFRNGDCEDSSLLLVDWLTQRGFEARVAVGDALAQGGHAWCVVNLGTEQYVLESTLNKTPQEPPTPELVSDKYQPHYLFDRTYLYFPKSLPVIEDDYFDARIWDALSYEPEGYGEQEVVGGISEP